MTFVIWASASADEKSPKYMICPLHQNKGSLSQGVLCSVTAKAFLVRLRSHMEDFEAALRTENPFWAIFLFFFLLLSWSETFLWCCHRYFWPTSAEEKRFMAVACTHSYSFVSIETLSPEQACVLELHKPLPVIRNTHRHGFFSYDWICFF